MALAATKTRSIELPFVGSMLSYDFTTTIDGRPYLFDVHFNERDGGWYFDLREIDRTPIVYGVKIVLGAYLGCRCRHQLFQSGVLVAVDLSGESRDATFEDLGTRVVVQWIPVLELIRRLDLPA